MCHFVNTSGGHFLRIGATPGRAAPSVVEPAGENAPQSAWRTACRSSPGSSSFRLRTCTGAVLSAGRKGEADDPVVGRVAVGADADHDSLQARVDADSGRILDRSEIQLGRGALDRVERGIGVRGGVGEYADLGDEIDRVGGRTRSTDKACAGRDRGPARQHWRCGCS